MTKVDETGRTNRKFSLGVIFISVVLFHRSFSLARFLQCERYY